LVGGVGRGDDPVGFLPSLPVQSAQPGLSSCSRVRAAARRVRGEGALRLEHVGFSVFGTPAAIASDDLRERIGRSRGAVVQPLILVAPQLTQELQLFLGRSEERRVGKEWT